MISVIRSCIPKLNVPNGTATEIRSRWPIVFYSQSRSTSIDTLAEVFLEIERSMRRGQTTD